MPTPGHHVFAALRETFHDGPAVVAHRGDSENFAENTLPAFESALRLQVPMQEFDVRLTGDGVPVCIHDESFDRTTDSARLWGPGALVAETPFAAVRELNASPRAIPGQPRVEVPTLEEVLDLLLPRCFAMVEQKAGPAADYLRELHRNGALPRCILQSFDWNFVADARRADPEVALALLGPTPTAPRIDTTVLDLAASIGAGMLHWHDRQLTADEVELTHGRGLLLCTYTTDDDLGFVGGSRMGFDAMCTNRPARMQHLRGQGLLRRLGS